MIIQWIVFLVLRGLFMEQSFIDEMKEALKTQRSEILKSLATQNDDMKNLIKQLNLEMKLISLLMQSKELY